MADTVLGNLTISPLSESLSFMKEFGFFEVVLPLILIFAIFYGVLTVIKIFGDPSEKTSSLYAVISFVAAFFVIASTDVVRMINEIIPSASFLLVIAVLILMMMGLFGFKPQEQDFWGKTKWGGKIAVIILIIIFLGVVDMSMENVEIPIIHDIASGFVDTGDDGDGGGGLSDEDTSNMVNFGVVIALLLGLPFGVIYLIVKSSSDTTPKAPK